MKKSNVKKMGIYLLQIGDKKYVGKDHDIHKQKRIKSHITSLKRKDHWNSEMQSDFDKGFPIRSVILYETEDIISDEELCALEVKYIELEQSYSLGYNKTHGGIGLSGIKFTDEQIEKKSEAKSGSNHHNSKTSLQDFLDIVSKLNEGLSNTEIAEQYNLHPRYVSLIRNRKRYIKWFEKYAPDYKIVNADKFRNSQRKLSDRQVVEIFNKSKRLKKSNIELSVEYNVDPSTISCIVNRKTFKEVTKDL